MLDHSTMAAQPVLITDGYRELNRILHAGGKFGIAGEDRIHMVRDIAEKSRARSILDYGSGGNEWAKLALGDAYDVRSYDPCVAGLDAIPEPADLVTCTDVLGHVELECLDAVLNDIQRCTKNLLLLIIETSPAKKLLPDGRNAHLIQQPMEWWLPKIMARWQVRHMTREANGFLMLCARYIEVPQ